MASAAADASRSYRSIPENGDYVSSDGPRRANARSGFSRRMAAVLGVGLLAGAAAFVVGRHGPMNYRFVPHRMRMVAPPPAPLYGPTQWGARRVEAYPPMPQMPQMPQVPPMWPMSPVRPMLPMPLMRRTTAVPASLYRRPSRTAFAPLATAAHEDDSDFTLDERVPTYQCSRGLWCRARLTVESQDGSVTIKAGYLVYSRTAKARLVDKRMHARIKRTTPARAPGWAHKLLGRVSGRLDEVNCPVTYDQVLAAITKAADAILSCDKSDQAACDMLITVGHCAAPAPPPAVVTAPVEEELTPCAKYVKSQTAAVSTLVELQEHCPDATFYYNRVGMSLPFCTTTCASRPGVKHTVYLDYYLQANAGSGSKKDCLSQAMAPSYNYLYKTIPSCDSAPAGGGDPFIASVADKSTNQMPEEVAQMTAGCGSTLDYAFFIRREGSLDEIISESCAAAPAPEPQAATPQPQAATPQPQAATPEPQPVPVPEPTVDYSGFPIDELVPTGQCAADRYCRARLTATEVDGVVTVSAGYYIYTVDGVTRTLDDFTHSRVSATTPAQAQSWAQKLVSGASGGLNGANCAVSVEQVAAALLQGTKDVLKCTDTDDPGCNAMVEVRTCGSAPPAPAVVTAPVEEELTPCAKFVKSQSTAVSTLVELQEHCPDATFYYNRVGMSLPFCTTTCASRPGVKHTVYLDYYLQANAGSGSKKDCLSQAMAPSYNYLYKTIPSCDSAPAGGGDPFIASVADKSMDQMPEEVAQMTASCGSTLDYAFFIRREGSLDDIINDSCAALA